MHWIDVVTLLVALTLVGVEFSVSAFVNPAVWQLESAPQLQVLRRLALVLGRVMPVWYPVSTLLLGITTWVNWHAPGRVILLAAAAIWALTSIASLVFLVPLNTRVAAGDPDWHRLSRAWDRRHRIRIVALATAAVLLACILIC